MSLVTRAQKGSKLSSAEMDDNLLWLSQTLSGSDGTGVIQVTGSSLDASNTPITSSFFTGDGRALTNVTASYLPGIDGSQLLNVTASYISPSIVIPVNGNNTEIQFNKNNALSGSVYLTYNYDSQSLEQGANNNTIGLFSHAEGNINTTLGNYSHAEGNGNRTGVYSYAIDSVTFDGSDTIILLDSSYGNVSSQFNSAYLLIKDISTDSVYKYDSFTPTWNVPNVLITIAGVNLTSIFTTGDLIALSSQLGTSLRSNPTNADQKFAGNGSHVEGNLVYAVNSFSHTEGYRSIAAGLYSHAEGDLTIALGDSSHAEGNLTTALGNSSHAEGSNTLAQGDCSHAEGVSTAALGQYSHAEGTNTKVTATGYASHAEGEFTLVPGYAAHAEGGFTTASGEYSHAEGSGSVALGIASHAQGWGTIASGSYQNVIGQYNVAFTSQSAFIIGDGDDDSNRHNVLFVSKSYFEVNAPNMYFTGLANSSQTYVVAIDTSTGQLSYTLASGVGSLTPPGGNDKAIQFNSGSGFSGSNKFTYDYDNNIVTLTGSILATTGFTGSLLGTASYVTGSIFDGTNSALSASYALSSSYVLSSSYALSSSYVLSSSYALSSSYVTGSIFNGNNLALSASYVLTSSYVTGSIFTSTNPALSASYALSSSQSTTASYALFSLNGGASTPPEGNSGEIQYNNGGVFGGVSRLTYDGTTLRATGSFTGSFAGSLFGTASWAQSASQALTASFVRTAQTASYVTGSIFNSTNPALSASYALSSSNALTASFVATASYVTGALFTNINPALTASHALTASYVSGSIFTSTNRALSASFALTASYVPSIRAGSASAASFSLIGGEYGVVVTLSPNYPNNNYAVTITGEDPRSWTVESKTNIQFTIQSNSGVALTGPVYWIAIPFNN